MAGLSLKTNLREPFVHIFVFLCSLPFFAFLCLSLRFTASSALLRYLFVCIFFS